MSIEWGAMPPPRLLEGGIRLLGIKAGESHVMAVLGPVVGLQTHWIEGNSKPCIGEGLCIHHAAPKVWKGYCPVLVSNFCPQGKKVGYFKWVLIVTEEIGEASLKWSRGSVVKVGRSGRKKNGPLSWENCSMTAPTDLPPPFDVKPYVLRACGLPNVPLYLQAAKPTSR